MAVIEALQQGQRWQNWSRSETAHPAYCARPRTVDEVVAVVKQARERGLPVKVVGAGHSFTAIAATSGIHIDLSRLSGLLSVDEQLRRVQLAAGTHLYDLPALLEPYGLAMENLGDIDRQTIAGATSTGTHGTGGQFRGISAQLVALTFVLADGSILRVSGTENTELLPAAKLGLGALGILVDVTIQCTPAFVIHADEKPESLNAVLDQFATRVASSDHFEFYWFPHTHSVLTKTNMRLPQGTRTAPLSAAKRWFDDTLMANGLFAATCATGARFPAAIPSINRIATHLTGNRKFSDKSTAVFTTDRNVRFREMEYAIPLEAVPDAVRQIQKLIADRGWRISFPIEVRAAAADDLWMSTATGRRSGYIAVHRYWREDPTEYFRAVEQIMLSFGGRPHWGKMHSLASETLQELYPKFDDFRAVRDRLDPTRLFTNPYLERVLG